MMPDASHALAPWSKTIVQSTHTLATLPQTLPAGQAHLYVADITDWVPSATEVLRNATSADEQTRALRFRKRADQERSLVAHGMLRLLLGRYLNREPTRLAFTTGAHGKPWIASNSVDHPGIEPPLHFNLAHAGGLVVIGIAERPLGVDIEMVPTTFDTLEELGPALYGREWPTVKAANATRSKDQFALEFTQRWARHEALHKATGLGIGSQSLSTMSTMPLDASEARRPLRLTDLVLTSAFEHHGLEQRYAASAAMDTTLNVALGFRLAANAPNR
jgi:4'-phosphopantetheinyl transferase